MKSIDKRVINTMRGLYERAEEIGWQHLQKLAQEIVDKHPELEMCLSGNGSWSFYRTSDDSPVMDWEEASHRTKYYDGELDQMWLPRRVWKDIKRFEEFASEHCKMFTSFGGHSIKPTSR